ncbi:MAG: putative metalloprotease CJM1_0395 family protein [Thermodesulfobacteriota bacterium]
MNISTSTYQAYGIKGSFYPRVNTPPADPSPAKTPARSQETSRNTAPDPASGSAKGENNGEGGNSKELTSESSFGTGLTEAEKKIVENLKQTDLEIKQHEMAHVAAGAGIVTSGANYTYKTGPDGQRYAVGGDVKINMSAVPGDPEATIDKMEKVRRTALAPASPSAQDRRVASKASALSASAMQELMVKTAREQAAAREDKAFGNLRKTAVDGYAKAQNAALDPGPSFSTAA